MRLILYVSPATNRQQIGKTSIGRTTYCLQQYCVCEIWVFCFRMLSSLANNYRKNVYCKNEMRNSHLNNTALILPWGNAVAKRSNVSFVMRQHPTCSSCLGSCNKDRITSVSLFLFTRYAPNSPLYFRQGKNHFRKNGRHCVWSRWHHVNWNAIFSAGRTFLKHFM